MLSENTRGDLGVLLHELEDGVLLDLGAGGSKVHESLEARIRLAENTVAVAGNDLAGLEGGPEVVLDVLLGELLANLCLHVQDPAEHLLGSKAVERAGKTEKTSAVAEEGVAESAANKVGGVGGDVAALVVTVESEVETEEIVEISVLLAALAEQLSKVVRPILGRVELLGADGVDLVGTEDESSNTGDFGKEGDAVVEDWLPVVGLVETLLVGAGELGLSVESSHDNGQLGHRVHILGEGLHELEDVLGEVGLLGKLLGKNTDLLSRGNFAGEEKPEHGLWEHLSAGGTLGKLLLAVLDGSAMKSDSLVGVKDGALPDHRLEASHSTNSVGDSDIADNLISVLLELLQESPLLGDNLLEHALELGLGGSGIAPGVDKLTGGLDSNEHSVLSRPMPL